MCDEQVPPAPKATPRCECGQVTKWYFDDEIEEWHPFLCFRCNSLRLMKAESTLSCLTSNGRLTEAQKQKFVDYMLAIARGPERDFQWWKLWRWPRYLWRKWRGQYRVFKLDKESSCTDDDHEKQ